jgi:hypothetical protein
MTKNNPTCERRHYEFVAAVVRDMTLVDCPTQADLDAARFHQRNAAHRFAVAFASDNPRFDRARFLKACGVED